MSDTNYGEMLECSTCEASELLCVACVHNLDLILQLQLRIEALEKRGSDMERDFLLERDRCTYARRQLDMVASSSTDMGMRLSAAIRRIELSYQDGTPL